MPHLTTDRKQVEGLSPYKPTIHINRKVHVKALGLYLRPRTVVMALLIASAGAWAVVQLIGGARR